MQMVLGETEAGLFREITKLRYEVYCEQRRYLNESDYEDGQETDHYDDRSVHVAAKTHDGVTVGTVRLVLGSETEKFPFEQHCSVSPQFERPPHQQSAEVSRLIVKRNSRRLTANPAQSARSACNGGPQITLELFRAMYRYSIRNGVRYWYAAMEKGLVRHLSRMGFDFVPIGPEGDYYGPVTTYVGDLCKLEDNLRQSRGATLAWIQDAPVSDWLLIRTITSFDASARQGVLTVLNGSNFEREHLASNHQRARIARFVH